MLEVTEYIKILIGLIAIVNPFGAVPLFISLTAGAESRERHKIINIVAIAVTVILLVALLIGEELLQFFGISINSFRVAGGILLLLMSVSMLNAKLSPTVQTKEEAEESKEKESIAVVPLAMPLLAGPGAITTVIIDAHKGSGAGHYLTSAVLILFLSLLIWMVLRLSPFITRHISATGINVFTRIMGLLLAAIAVEFMANGLKSLFPGLS
ncbi:MAG: YchE family NAAT transporter [Deltaproteobacteria bacterium]|nr:YchE family NAAT transporter [Deltaproteobacteria bacterium]